MSEELEEAVINCVLDAVDCLLMMESLKEDSLMEEEMHSFRGVGDKNRRQRKLSARVILMKSETTGKQMQALFISINHP